MGISPIILQVLNSTTNPGNSLAGKRYLGYPLLHRGLPKHRMAADGCPGFFSEFNIKWQPKDVQDLLWNLILAIFLEMTPCCLHLSLRSVSE